MLLDPLSFLENVTARYSSVVGLIMGGEEIVLVTEPAAAQHVLIDKASIYRKVRHAMDLLDQSCVHARALVGHC